MIAPTLTGSRDPAGNTTPSERGGSSTPTKNWHARLGRCEWGLAIVLLLASIALHLRFATHVGALWRDETNSVSLATLPSLGEIWRFLDYDSFPVLFFCVLRAWTTLFGAEDLALRTLGLLIGLGILAAFWLNARAYGVKWPIVSFALLGLNPMFIRYGDSTRAYGLGILLILLTLRSFWRLVDSPAAVAPKRVVTACLFAVLSVHCLYYNSVLLFAIASGACAAALYQRAWRKVVVILAIGMLAAGSLLPYVPMMRRMREWTFMVNYPADFAWLWKRVGEVIGLPRPFFVWIWVALFVGSVAFTVLAVLRCDKREGTRSRREIPPTILFGGVALIVGVIGYASFLNILDYYTQPWYYITLTGFAACAMEVVLGKPAMSSVVLKGSRIALGVLFLAVSVRPAWSELRTRHTNVDSVAEKLKTLTSEGDVILMSRWECAITLCRYYRGPAPVITLPPIEDHRFHRYDLVLRQMMTTDPIQPVLQQLEETLRTGHRVFLAGALPFPEESVSAAPPFYRDEHGGLHGGSYYAVWPRQAGHFLRKHAISARGIMLSGPEEAPVKDYEQLELGVVEGWR